MIHIDTPKWTLRLAQVSGSDRRGWVYGSTTVGPDLEVRTYEDDFLEGKVHVVSMLLRPPFSPTRASDVKKRRPNTPHNTTRQHVLDDLQQEQKVTSDPEQETQAQTRTRHETPNKAAPDQAGHRENRAGQNETRQRTKTQGAVRKKGGGVNTETASPGCTCTRA